MNYFNKKLPKISVIICTYNCEKYIKKTVKSILDQTYKNIEILILDNASTDKTVKIIENMKINNLRLFKSEINLGAYGGVNFLLSFCKGKYIGINDHDDIWHYRKIEKQINFLEKNLDYVGCGGLSIVFFEKNNNFRKLRRFNWKNFVPHPSLVFRNGNYRYNLDIKYKTDSYFMKNILSKYGKLFLFNDYLYIHRMRFDGNNLSKKRNIKDSLLYTFKTGNFFSLIKNFILIILPIDDFYYKYIMCGKIINNIDKYGFDKDNI